MDYNQYVIMDDKLDFYNVPFYFINDDVCLRALANIVNNDESHGFYKYPEDYTLYHVGSFVDGDISNPVAVSPRRFICCLKDLKKGKLDEVCNEAPVL